jgi:hypothetical protein
MSCHRCEDDLWAEIDAQEDEVEEGLSPEVETIEPGSQSRRPLVLMLVLATFVLGVLVGYLLPQPPTAVDANATFTGPSSETAPAPQEELVDADFNLLDLVHPPDGYTIPVTFDDIGPQMLAAGAIDYERFAHVYEQAGQPLTTKQQLILTQGLDEKVHFTQENAYFLLNFFWALGLVNQNPLLVDGPLVTHSQGQIDRFASTGGWTIGQKSPAELVGSAAIVQLTAEQQDLLETVAHGAYRPCCNNHTAFPDCNHGMALLGLLQLMAAQDATIEEMFEAAKYANAYWFPEQTVELAIFFKATQGLDFADVDAVTLVGPQFSSGAGSRAVRQWLADNNVWQQSPGGGSCGV